MDAPELKTLPHDERDNLESFFYEEDEVAVVLIPFRLAGIGRVGHAHHYDHTSFVAHGALRWWKDGVDQGVVHAPIGIRIQAGCFHKFVAVEDNTVLLCIHNTHGFAPELLEAGLVKEHHK